MRKISVGREHRHVVADTKLRQEGVDRSDLYAAPPAAVSQVCGPDVIVTVRYDQRQRGEPIQYLSPISRARKALKKLLENETGRQDRFPGFDAVD